MNDVTSQASFRLRPPAREQLVESLVRQAEKPQKPHLQREHLQNWDSSLLIILPDFRQHGRVQELEVDIAYPSDGLQRLLRPAPALDGESDALQQQTPKPSPP